MFEVPSPTSVKNIDDQTFWIASFTCESEENSFDTCSGTNRSCIVALNAFTVIRLIEFPPWVIYNHNDDVPRRLSVRGLTIDIICYKLNGHYIFILLYFTFLQFLLIDSMPYLCRMTTDFVARSLRNKTRSDKESFGVLRLRRMRYKRVRYLVISMSLGLIAILTMPHVYESIVK